MMIAVTLDTMHWQAVRALLGRASFEEAAPLIGMIMQQVQQAQEQNTVNRGPGPQPVPVEHMNGEARG